MNTTTDLATTDQLHFCFTKGTSLPHSSSTLLAIDFDGRPYVELLRSNLNVILCVCDLRGDGVLVQEPTERHEAMVESTDGVCHCMECPAGCVFCHLLRPVLRGIRDRVVKWRVARSCLLCPSAQWTPRAVVTYVHRVETLGVR